MDCFHPFEVKNPQTGHYILVPCGKCVACRESLQKDWIFRLQREQDHSNQCLFVTLTYDPEHEPWRENDGMFTLSVNKRDPQLFLKRLRKELHTLSPDNDRISYYLVSEYGTQGLRPHYHAIIFNKSEVDLRPLIEKAWQLGFVCIGDVTPASLTYTTKYVFKDCVVPPGAAPTFALMSRRPAIGECFTEKEEIETFTDNHPYLVNPGGIKQRLPRFYKNRFGVAGSTDFLSQEEKYYRNHPGATYEEFRSWLKETQNAYERNKLNRIKHNRIL